MESGGGRGGRRGGAEEEGWRREEERGREGEKRKWSKIIFIQMQYTIHNTHYLKLNSYTISLIPYEQPHTRNT